MSRAQFARRRLLEFLFPQESDTWLSILRVGVAAQLLVFCFSIRSDWRYLLAASGGLSSRGLAEKILSLESVFVPRLGWFVNLGTQAGLNEQRVLAIVWFALTIAAFLLLIGLFCRTAAITAWLLHLATIKSGDFVAYGVDNFVTIALFYLMLAPLPDRYSVDARWRKFPAQDRHLLGFWRRVLQTHLCLIYFFGGIAKDVGVGWWNGEAVWRALIRPPFNLIPPQTLLHWKILFPAVGVATVILETAYPFLIWQKSTARTWLIGVLTMHIAIGAAMGMYLFALIMIVLNLAAFGPGVLWRQSKVTSNCRSYANTAAP
ncbi:MAG: hypothetical protein QOG48_1142 [Verrucomicrobiota bacterium]